MPNDTQEDPELATNEEWRDIMVRARKEPRPDYPNGLTQLQLGEKVGASQVAISKIESGEFSSSKLVLPICRVLGIPEPRHYADEKARTWSELGHFLRSEEPEEYDAYLNLVETAVKRMRERKEARERAEAERTDAERGKRK